MFGFPLSHKIIDPPAVTSSDTTARNQSQSHAISRLYVRTVEAVDWILVKYAAVGVEAFSAGDVASDSVKHHCKVQCHQLTSDNLIAIYQYIRHLQSSGYMLI